MAGKRYGPQAHKLALDTVEGKELVYATREKKI